MLLAGRNRQGFLHSSLGRQPRRIPAAKIWLADQVLAPFRQSGVAPRNRICAVQLAFDRNPKSTSVRPRKDRAKQRSGGKLGHEMSHWRGSNRQVMTGTAMT